MFLRNNVYGCPKTVLQTVYLLAVPFHRIKDTIAQRMRKVSHFRHIAGNLILKQGVELKMSPDPFQVDSRRAFAGPRRDLLPPDSVLGDRIARSEERPHAAVSADFQGERLANAARHFGNFQLQVKEYVSHYPSKIQSLGYTLN